MKKVDVESLEDINNTLFHFTLRDNIPNIDRQGLQARKGEHSEIIDEKGERVYLSKGPDGILYMKTCFINAFKSLSNIPSGYRKYFGLTDFSSTQNLDNNIIYEALYKRFVDEVYLVVDAQEGEDFIKKFSLGDQIRCLWDHNIDPKKISLVTTPNGDTALDVILYLFNKTRDNNPGNEEQIRQKYPQLFDMIDYIKKSKNVNNTKLSKSSSSSIRDSEITLY